MGSRKSSRANVVAISGRARTRGQARQRYGVACILGIGGLAGVALGAAVGFQESGDLGKAAAFVGAVSKEIAVSQGIMRANTPQPGAYYRSCADARAAGVAPLYAREPGYRPPLDRDGDGAAETRRHNCGSRLFARHTR